MHYLFLADKNGFYLGYSFPFLIQVKTHLGDAWFSYVWWCPKLPQPRFTSHGLLQSQSEMLHWSVAANFMQKKTNKEAKRVQQRPNKHKVVLLGSNAASWHLLIFFILGGVLIIITAAMNEDGQYYGNIKGNTQHVFPFLSHLWQEMVLDGRITQACFKSFNSINIVNKLARVHTNDQLIVVYY